jgi:predicted dehydrogenase
MGLLHLQNCLKIDGVEVVAAADTRSKALSKAEKQGVECVFRDYRTMLQECALDAAIISLPNYLHEPSIIDCVERSVHVFIEKPLGRNLAECARIKAQVQKNDTLLVVGHNYRYFEHVQQLKQELDAGVLGDIEIASLDLFTNGPFAHPLNPVPVQDWWFDAEKLGGGALLDLGYHLVDLFNWFFPNTVPLYTSLSVGWFQRMVFPEFNFKINLQGTATVRSTDHFLPQNPYLHAGKEAIKNLLRRMVGKQIHPLTYTYYFTSYYHELKDFFGCVTRNMYHNPIASVNVAYETAKIVDAAYSLVEHPYIGELVA